ncbi:MAG: hypothetical protein ABSA21_03730 [Candidatus Limnocylindrales bacterium]|jgi:triphosphoribosyl-dephospho-CoA synthetase
MTLQLHRPDAQGGLRPNPQGGRDWREGLRSRRWRAAALRNTEMNPTSTRVAVLFWAALAALTFALLLLGYGTNFWR